MNDSQRAFTYTPQQLQNLKVGLSVERFQVYLNLAHGDEKAALKRYEINTALSEAMYGVLQGFEIILRNSMHETMKRDTLRDDWFDHIGLRAREMESVQKAKDKIARKGKILTVPRVIAELTFGFWTSLTGRPYESRLWIPHLFKAFPHKRLGRGQAFGRLDSIRILRNQVAHHECILLRNLEQDYCETIEAASWICPDTAVWIRETTRFEAAYRIIKGRTITPTILHL